MEALERSMPKLRSAVIRRLPHNRSHSSTLSVLPNQFLSIRRTKPSLPGCSLKYQRSFSKCNRVQAAISTTSAPHQGLDYADAESKNGRDLTGADAGSEANYDWIDAEGNVNEKLLSKFRGLTLAAEDRVQVHTILAKQRDNWNHLFHSTIVIAIVSAAASAAMNGAEPALGLTLVSSILNFLCAAVMTVVNNFQPSQLAEEQRRAARFFKRLIMEVEATLQIEPRMREKASVYWRQQVGTLYALDAAFPLPLAPQGLEKFPREVLPSELSCPQDLEGDKISPFDSEAEVLENAIQDATRFCGGWTLTTEKYLKDVILRIHERDVPHMLVMARKAKRLNLIMARTSPVLAVAAAACSIANIVPATAFVSRQFPWLGAALTVGALFTHSMSHALQLGSGFETYRNYAGYYQDIKNTLEKVLELPAEMREDWELVRAKINMQLGHSSSKVMVKDNNHMAGRLF